MSFNKYPLNDAHFILSWMGEVKSSIIQVDNEYYFLIENLFKSNFLVLTVDNFLVVDSKEILSKILDGIKTEKRDVLINTYNAVKYGKETFWTFYDFEENLLKSIEKFNYNNAIVWLYNKRTITVDELVLILKTCFKKLIFVKD